MVQSNHIVAISINGFYHSQSFHHVIVNGRELSLTIYVTEFEKTRLPCTIMNI